MTELAIPDPHTLLAKAIDLGAGVDTIERLVSLAREVRTIRAREAWYAAMAQFQQNCPSIKKSLTARIQTARAQFNYRYAPLDEVLATVQPILGPLELSVSWRSRVEPDHVVVSCRVAHALGHVEESGDISMPVDLRNPELGATPPQRVGIALTYARRYSLLFALGLAPEDDDDAAHMPAPPSRKPTERPPMDEIENAVAAAPEPAAYAAQWDSVVSDYVARLDEATTREEVAGHSKTWLTARDAVPKDRWHWVQEAITRAQKRLG